jgi:RNA polymerase sigma-70 factor (ECF subfamily)
VGGRRSAGSFGSRRSGRTTSGSGCIARTLNRAVALAEWKGAEEGLHLLEAVAPPGWLAGHYLWDATHGELLRRLGRFTEAERLLARAEACAPTRAERAIFGRKLARCRAGDQTR